MFPVDACDMMNPCVASPTVGDAWIQSRKRGDMRSLDQLIDEAAAICHGYAKLARRLDVTPQRVDEWKHGKRPLTPETVGLLCDVCHLDGEEARRLLALAVVSNPKNADRAEVLRRAFFVCWAIGAAILPDNSSGAMMTDRTHNADVTSLTVYRLSSFWSRVCRIARAWLSRTRLPCPLARYA